MKSAARRPFESRLGRSGGCRTLAARGSPSGQRLSARRIADLRARNPVMWLIEQTSLSAGDKLAELQSIRKREMKRQHELLSATLLLMLAGAAHAIAIDPDGAGLLLLWM